MEEEEEEENSKNSSSSSSINDLPVELIQGILLRLPTKHLARLRCVSKVWLSLLSDPDFLKSHFRLSIAPTHRCLFLGHSEVHSADLEALLSLHHDDDDGGHAAAAVKVSLPLKIKNTFSVFVMGSCGGFVVLNKYPHFLIIWNPLNGSHKRISCHHVVRRRNASDGGLLGDAFLFGFGYDASRDDYLVVLAWRDHANKKKNEGEEHFDIFSLRTNSWKSLEVALPSTLRRSRWESGWFLNGAIHWVGYPLDVTDDNAIFVFDLNGRSFSEIPLPEQVVMCGPSLMVLGGFLALYLRNHDDKIEIWVMKEYRVQASWTLYEISSIFFEPVCLSEDGDIIGFDGPRGVSKYNVRGELLQHYAHFRGLLGYTMYTESLLPVPNDSEEDTKKKGRQVRRECFERLDVTDQNQNEVNHGKRIRSTPIWTCHFYCN